MKKTILTGLLTTTLLISMMPTGTVEAAESKDAVSEGRVNFKSAETTPTPIDPTDPTVPPRPIVPDPERPGTDGLLRFDRVPVLDFGTAEIKGQTVVQDVLEDVYTEKKESGTGETFYTAPTVLVTDVRSTYSGWNVGLAMTEFKGSVAEEKLAGATITLNNAAINSYSGINDASLAPTSLITEDGIELNGEAQTFMTADAAKGMGQWGASFFDGVGLPLINRGTEDNRKTSNAIQLTIPATASKKEGANYTSVLTWTLTDTPA